MKTLRHRKSGSGTRRALTPAEKALVAELVADGLSIQDKFRPEALYKRTGQGHYDSGTVEEIRKTKGKSEIKRKQRNAAGRHLSSCLSDSKNV
jgi:hypothetical protein